MTMSLLGRVRSDLFFRLARAQGLAPADGRVVTGPFSGMLYERKRPYYPLLLGTYESELNDTWEELCRTPFDTVVDVGGAEGYYVVGMARRMAKTKTIAFELEPRLRKLATELAEANGVADRVEVLGLCDAPAFARCVENGARTLVIMDVEGAEAILLDPFVAPHLKTATILVELHDAFYPEMGTLIRSRFAQTHSILEVWSRDRTPADFPLPLAPWKRRLFGGLLRFMMWERRGVKMRWFYLKPDLPSAA
jgi:hypothetical protein